jgi:thymidylate synthase (FAD)
MKLQNYADMQINLIQKPEYPGILIQLASELTQKSNLTASPASPKLLKYLITANHTSLFEHVSTTWLIRNVSRSFLAQITRHRMASYTSGSQHYQDYRDYPLVVGHELQTPATASLFKYIDQSYTDMVDAGIMPEEARQILPNAKAVNLLWTINVRSLINFLNLRICERNVREMRYFAERVRNACLVWWPEVFTHVGPDCLMLGRCRQGRMMAQTCKENGSPWKGHTSE